MRYEQLARRSGPFGMLASGLIWTGSWPVLWFAMRATQAAARGGIYQIPKTANDVRALHAIALTWGLLFVLLQLMAPLLLAFTLRACYRLRSAVCFTLGASCFVVLDAMAMLGMLVWLRVRLGAG